MVGLGDDVLLDLDDKRDEAGNPQQGHPQRTDPMMKKVQPTILTLAIILLLPSDKTDGPRVPA